MNILVLAESLRINETSSGIVSSTFISALKKGGHNVTCLYEKFKKPLAICWLEGVELREITYGIHEKKALDFIPKLRAIPTFLDGYNRRFKNQIMSWKHEIESTLLNSGIELIIVLGSGSSFLPHFAMLQVKTKIPWIANFHDPYPMSLYPDPYRKKRNLIYRKQEGYTKEIIRKATLVSFPSLLLKDLMQQSFPEIKNKSLILPHIGVELNNLPTNENDQLVILNKSKFNILHAGTLLGPRKIDSLFQAFEKFINSKTEIKENAVLTVLGKVAKEHSNIIKRNNLNYKIITERVSYKRSLELTKQADISLIIEADAETSPFMPGKLADLIFLEKPILALTPLNSETLRVLGDNYPYTARTNDVDEIYNQLLTMWNLRKVNKLKLVNKEALKYYVSEEKFNITIKNHL
ncbi:hypothetical protein [Tamlana sp. I1]|uniref:hypothetical protein n=1 Tax=Tamlana sp. I1 TaxID=2762061 RepID=UPI00188F929A|nr:hypothetical protein [Tamlana sp. I1]